MEGSYRNSIHRLALHMKISKKQKQEINFLATNFGGFEPTNAEIEDYISATVFGKKETTDKLSTNRLRNAKTSLDRSVKMWREDLEGKISGGYPLLRPDEMMEWFTDPFGESLVKSVIKSTRWNNFSVDNPIANPS